MAVFCGPEGGFTAENARIVKPAVIFGKRRGKFTADIFQNANAAVLTGKSLQTFENLKFSINCRGLYFQNRKFAGSPVGLRASVPFISHLRRKVRKKSHSVIWKIQSGIPYERVNLFSLYQRQPYPSFISTGSRPQVTPAPTAAPRCRWPPSPPERCPRWCSGCCRSHPDGIDSP